MLAFTLKSPGKRFSRTRSHRSTRASSTRSRIFFLVLWSTLSSSKIATKPQHHNPCWQSMRVVLWCCGAVATPAGLGRSRPRPAWKAEPAAASLMPFFFREPAGDAFMCTPVGERSPTESTCLLERRAHTRTQKYCTPRVRVSEYDRVYADSRVQYTSVLCYSTVLYGTRAALLKNLYINIPVFCCISRIVY